MALPDPLELSHIFNTDITADGYVDKAELDNQLATIVTKYNELLEFVRSVIRSDGTLHDEIVRTYNIHESVGLP